MNKLALALTLLAGPLLAQSASINGVPNQTLVGPSGTPQYIAPQAIAGCGVEYVSGLTYTVGACNYSINGVTYNSPLSSITLPAADVTNPEIDVIFVDTTGVVQVIQGTPAVTPQQPVVDPSTQLQLTFVLVPATATTPANTTSVLIYDEGTEWTAARGGTSSANVNLTSTNNPYHGTKDTEFGAGGTVATTTYAQYTKPAAGTVSLGNYNTLTLYLRNKAAWAKTRSVTVQWYNGSTALGTAVVLSNGAYGLDATGNITSYQQISIPASTFGIPGTPATTVRFTVSGSGSNLTGFYLDQVTLQGGNGGVVLPTTLMNFRGTWTATATYSPNDAVVSGSSGYVALSSNTNTAVSNTATWSALAPTSGAGAASGVWQHEGTIISPTLGEQYNATEPSLLYEGSPQLLTGTTGSIFKMWWTCGWDNTGLCYAESVDGEVWKRATSPVIARSTSGPSHGQVFHYGSTYYYYASTPPFSSAQFDRYESADGIAWTLTHAAVMSRGGAGAWDNAALGNIYVIPSAGTWLAMYEANGTGVSAFAMGVASSADQGVTWTKYSGNPVIERVGGSGQAGGPDVHLVGGTYYVWGQCSAVASANPDDICRWSSPTFLSNSWTVNNSGNPVFTRASVDEGAGNPVGQIADPSMVEVNGSVYMAYEGVLAQNGTTPDAFHVKLATAPYTFANLVTTNEGNATAFRSSGAFNNLNLSTCVYWDNNFNRTPCANDTGQLLLGTFDFQGGSATPSLGQNLYWDGSNNRYVVAGSASTEVMNTGTGEHSLYVYPSGSAGATLGTGVKIFGATTTGLAVGVQTTFDGAASANTVVLTSNSTANTQFTWKNTTSKTWVPLVVGSAGGAFGAGSISFLDTTDSTTPFGITSTGISATHVIDTSLTAGTAVICPNGSGGALTTTGCVSPAVATGTSALGTSAIASGACATAVTTSATGVATTDVIAWGFNADPTGVTGYIPSTNGMLTIISYPTANNVNFKVCNNTGASITPGAITLNWRVPR